MKTTTMMALTALIAAPHLAQAQAGDKGGNGGNAKICFDDPEIAALLANDTSAVSRFIPKRYLDHIISIETLDLLEAKRPTDFRSGPPLLIDLLPGELPEDYAARVLAPLDSFKLASRSAKYTLSDILKAGKKSLKVRGITPDPVVPTPDIDPIILAGDGCVYSTIAVQRSIGDGKRELAIDDRLFNLRNAHTVHSEQSKAALIFHEYLLAAEAEAQESKRVELTEGVRELVSTLMKRATTLADVIEVINRRKLFSQFRQEAPIESAASLTDLEQLFTSWQENSNTIINGETSRSEPGFSTRVVPLVESLPHWYRKNHRITLTRGDDYCIQVDLSRGDMTSWKTRCLGTKDQAVLEEIGRVRLELIQGTIWPAIEKQIEAGKAERLAALEPILNRYQSSVLSEPAYQRLRTRTIELATTGARGRFVTEDPELMIRVLIKGPNFFFTESHHPASTVRANADQIRLVP
jgi:hypothetical protein